tara:strand:- start:153 stop:887 length:735 start_codon:yes stop_codon:yes gene_type:complete
MNETKTNISIISHGQSETIKNILKDLSNENFFNKILITINIKENYDDLKEFKNLPLQFIVNEKPKGFGENHNYAYSLCKCNYFIMINPDVELKKLKIKNLLNYFEIENVQLLTPTAIDENNLIQDNARRYPTILTPFLRKIGLYNKKYYLDSNVYTSVDWISGMFMAIKSNMFENIGGFDENFYMYYEDVDLCRRIKNSGGKILRINTEEIFHVGQKSSHKKIKYFLIHLRSMFYYHFKYLLKL